MPLEFIRPYNLSIRKLRELVDRKQPVGIDLAAAKWMLAFPCMFDGDRPTRESLARIKTQLAEIERETLAE